MNNMSIDIWGRTFKLPVVIKQFKGMDISDTQRQAVANFKKNVTISDSLKEKVEAYILNNGLKENGINTVDNIFKYVMPISVYVPKEKRRIVAILCNYKYDMEHGLAIVFENEEYKQVGPQDMVL